MHTSQADYPLKFCVQPRNHQFARNLALFLAEDWPPGSYVTDVIGHGEEATGGTATVAVQTEAGRSLGRYEYVGREITRWTGQSPFTMSWRADPGTAEMRRGLERLLAEHRPPDGPPRHTVDTGQALLEPVSARELAGLEPILAELWRTIDEGALSDSQRHQIMAMAELLTSQRAGAVAGSTPRWSMVGSVRAVLKYLMKEMPRDALAWWKLIELLERIDWSTLAAELPA